MWTRIERRLRRSLGGVLPHRFPRLYSTLDRPCEVPVQVSAYELALDKYLAPGDAVLDVGCGLGYGLRIMAGKAERLAGLEVDRRAVRRCQPLVQEVHAINEVRLYRGRRIPYGDGAFDVVTCVDVLEHVPDYDSLILEMVRVSGRAVLVSTPMRRPEHTKADGRPKNRWHLREWSYEELDSVLQRTPGVRVDWNFLDGPWNGPFRRRSRASAETMALTPALLRT